MTKAKTAGGVGFLSEVQRHREFDLVEIAKTASDLGLRRVYTFLGKQLPHVPDAILRQRFLVTMSQVVHGLAEIERLRRRRRPSRRHFDVERAIDNLIDMTAGASGPIARSSGPPSTLEASGATAATRRWSWQSKRPSVVPALGSSSLCHLPILINCTRRFSAASGLLRLSNCSSPRPTASIRVGLIPKGLMSASRMASARC
jgi:Tetracyclin repressor-like, C-terminal domain